MMFSLSRLPLVSFSAPAEVSSEDMIFGNVFLPKAWGTLVLLLATLFSPAALAEYDDEVGGGRAVVIQNRQYRMAHEFSFSAGLVPMDAFYKGISGSARYTLHLNDFFAWEMGGGTYALNIDTGLKKQLVDNFSVSPESIDQLQGFIDSNIMVKPVYGKYALFNRQLIYTELFFVAGGGVAYYSDQSFRPGPDYGAGIRFFFSDWFSLRADIRHYIFFNGVPVLDPNARIDNVLHLSVGASFNFGTALFPLIFGED